MPPYAYCRETHEITKSLDVEDGEGAAAAAADGSGFPPSPPLPPPPLTSTPFPFFSNIFLNLTFFWSSVRTRLGFMPISMHLSYLHFWHFFLFLEVMSHLPSCLQR